MPPAAIAEEFGVEVDTATVATPRFNVCPSEDVLVVARGGTGPSLGWMRWGFVPWFARDATVGPRSINARAETLATARAFREAFQRRRCLIVADGFYEWRKEGTERLPYFIRLASRRPFAMAGIWERWTGAGKTPLLSCAIVTCAANAIVAPIHGRMPVIVPPETRGEWLAADAAPSELSTLLRPHPADVMESYPVSKLVNTPRNDAPECIRPLPAVDA
jgi:putative SOS response-associated peptidase YedK